MESHVHPQHSHSRSLVAKSQGLDSDVSVKVSQNYCTER